MPTVEISQQTEYTVQIRYRGGEWITLTRVTDRMAAVRRAALAYRDAVSPDGRVPTQVRLLAAA